MTLLDFDIRTILIGTIRNYDYSPVYDDYVFKELCLGEIKSGTVGMFSSYNKKCVSNLVNEYIIHTRTS